MSAVMKRTKDSKTGREVAQIDLMALLRVILAKIWLVIVCALVGALLALLYAEFLATPEYQTSVSLYVSNTDGTTYSDASSQDLNTSRSLVDTYIVILENDVVQNALSDYMLGNYDNDLLAKAFKIQEDESGASYISSDAITACTELSSVDETEVLKITATTTNAEVSAIVCDSYAAIAPEYLTRIVKAGSVEVIGEAIIPTSAVSPNVPRMTMMGGLIGLVLALVIIICLELFNNKIRSAEDIESQVDCPVIGEIASFSDGKNKTTDRAEYLLTAESIPFYITESYKALRTNFVFTVSASEKKTVVVTSASPNEGKSTTSSNLAISLAQLGHKVLLIDADLRKSVQHKIFGLDNTAGLSTLLCGMQKLDDVLQKDVVEGMDVLTSGVIPPNPAELLGSKNMSKLLEQAAEKYDDIIIDAPPINTVSDAVTINGEIAGILLVARYDNTKNDDIARAVKAIELANLNILGFVLNDVLLKRSSGYYKSYYKKYGKRYGYGYGYGYGYSNKENNTDIDGKDMTHKKE